MNTNSNQPDPTLFVDQPKPPDAFQAFAIRVGTAIRAALLILFWVVIATAGLAAAYLAIRSLIWAVTLIQAAIGMP